MRSLTVLKTSLAAFVIIVMAVEPSPAGYLSVSSSIQIISPPASVQVGALQDDAHIRTFVEQQSLTLSSNISVDDTASGTFKSPGSLMGGMIQAGMMVDSYFFHSDPVSAKGTYDGTVTFTTAILGVIVLDKSLDATDTLLGAPNTLYPNGVSARGLELSSKEDYFSLSNDFRTLTFHFHTAGVVDEVRVVTAATVPEPASFVLMGLGGLSFLGLSTLRRKRAAA